MKNLTALTGLEFKYINGLNGNLGVLPDSLLLISNLGGSSSFTWTTTNRTYVLATEDIQCDNIDRMLMDMANMQAKFKDDYDYSKTIKLLGSRTPLSDEAVATLQSKGYTVSVTPA